jgi:hypothetical protein
MVKKLLVVAVIVCAGSSAWSADPAPAPAKDTKPVADAAASSSASPASSYDPQSVMHSSPIMQTAEERAVEKALREGKDPREAVKEVQRQSSPSQGNPNPSNPHQSNPNQSGQK